MLSSSLLAGSSLRIYTISVSTDQHCNKGSFAPCLILRTGNSRGQMFFKGDRRFRRANQPRAGAWRASFPHNGGRAGGPSSPLMEPVRAPAHAAGAGGCRADLPGDRGPPGPAFQRAPRHARRPRSGRDLDAACSSTTVICYHGTCLNRKVGFSREENLSGDTRASARARSHAAATQHGAEAAAASNAAVLSPRPLRRRAALSGVQPDRSRCDRCDVVGSACARGRAGGCARAPARGG